MLNKATLHEILLPLSGNVNDYVVSIKVIMQTWTKRIKFAGLGEKKSLNVTK